MTLEETARRHLIESMVSTIVDNTERLTALDQAIGDGDHGFNMKRGFESVLAELDSIAARPLPAALKAMGMQLVMKVGGASGPLYGTLIMALGKNLPDDGALSLSDFSRALGGAVEAVKARGKSDAGQKTMLDVLIPVRDAVAAGGDDLLDTLPVIANEAAQATIPMLAVKGRASFLGERSMGHMDPGACSSALITAAVCRAAGEIV